MRFYFNDVFAVKRYSGNQLATFLDCEGLESIEMQRIAKEVNFSETTFVTDLKEKGGGYDVRIFTPNREVDFAGHPTLGTADVIRKHVIDKTTDKVVLNLKVGQIPVTFSSDGLAWMQQMPPRFGKDLERNDVARALGLRPDAIDTRWPIQEVSTGFPHIIIPLLGIKSLHRAKVDLDLYRDLVRGAWAENLLIFCLEGQEEGQQLSVRVFPIMHGIAEDPATGSGNGCLAAYLSRHRCLGGTDVDVQVGQGYEIGRPSSLFLRSRLIDGAISVSVGGKVVPVASGTWDI
jgi:trans-2,3-dihydro-3-hydroxyanthranilate isomerase